MKFLILADVFSLESWLLYDQAPTICPQVYNFFNYLGSSETHCFHAIIINKEADQVKVFPNGSQIELKKLAFPNHYAWKVLAFFRQYRYARKLLKQEKFDVVYGMSFFSINAARLGKQFNLSSVSRIFGSLIYYELQKRRYLRIYTRYLFQVLEIKNPSDLVICTQDGTQFDRALAHFNRQKKDDVHILFNGIAPSLRDQLGAIPLTKSLPVSPSVKRCICMGRLTNWKRQDLAIQLMDYLVNECGDNSFRLTILGMGENERRLRRMIANLHLNEYVEIMAPIPHSEIPSLLSSYHIVFSLYDASNLSNSIWEASLAGKLIVTRNTGETSLIFKHRENALVWDEETPMSAIGQALIKLIGKDISAITARARTDINQLIPSWEKRIEKELKLIIQLHTER